MHRLLQHPVVPGNANENHSHLAFMDFLNVSLECC